jgi:hypothetical protein
MHETKNFTDALFVDTAFSLYHNGNLVFDKVWNVPAKLLYVVELNLNEQYKELMNYVSPSITILAKDIGYKPSNSPLEGYKRKLLLK